MNCASCEKVQEGSKMLVSTFPRDDSVVNGEYLLRTKETFNLESFVKLMYCSLWVKIVSLQKGKKNPSRLFCAIGIVIHFYGNFS